MNFKILTDTLLGSYIKEVGESPLEKMDRIARAEHDPSPHPVDCFQFYKSVSSVYSSKIEGEDIDFDSYFKHKFLNIAFQPDYTRKADDLYATYDFIDNHTLTFEDIQKAHIILSQNLLSETQRGMIRSNLMFVINKENKKERKKLFFKTLQK